jgi:Lrp/AsnC family transcriptional regulator, leucine-responsive regulatory protein
MRQKEGKMERNMLVESNNERRSAGMTLQKETPLDSTDWHILRELQQDARLSYRELGRRVGLSAPGTAERVRKLEDAGVLMGYHAQLNLAKVGLPLTAWIQLRCAPGKCLMKTTHAADFPEVMEMHKLSGQYCSLLKVVVPGVAQLEACLERLGEHGELISNIVLFSPLTSRILEQEPRQEKGDLLPEQIWAT